MEVDVAAADARAQWRSPELVSKMAATQLSAVEGVDGAISVWVAGERNRILGQE